MILSHGTWATQFGEAAGWHSLRNMRRHIVAPTLAPLSHYLKIGQISPDALHQP
jgi:hypothetical protein